MINVFTNFFYWWNVNNRLLFYLVHGEWGQWTPFSNCSKSECGFGSILRTRECDSPANKYGGDPCPGVDAHERRGCNVEVCPGMILMSVVQNEIKLEIKCRDVEIT